MTIRDFNRHGLLRCFQYGRAYTTSSHCIHLLLGQSLNCKIFHCFHSCSFFCGYKIAFVRTFTSGQVSGTAIPGLSSRLKAFPYILPFRSCFSRPNCPGRAGKHGPAATLGCEPSSSGLTRKMYDKFFPALTSLAPFRATRTGRRPANRPQRPGAPHPAAGCAGWSGCRSGRPAPRTRRRCGRGGG